jgi:two-component system sporulation sensor kinase A
MESETQYRQLVELAQEGVWVLDADYNTVFVNPKMAKLLGYAESEMIGKSLFEFLKTEHVNIAKQYLSKYKQGVLTNFEYEFTRKDGSSIYTDIVSSPLKDDEGNFSGTLALVADITERKRTETALKNSEEQFRNLAEQSPNMIFINHKGKIIYANKEAEEAMGYTKEELYSPDFNFMCLIAPEFKELVKAKFTKHMAGEDIDPYEYRAVRKDGTTINAINNTKIIDYNGEPALLGVVTDITEIKKMKEAVIESEEKFRAIADSALDAIVLIDDKQKIVYWNPAAERTFGYPRREALGKEATCLIPAQRRKRVEKQTEKPKGNGLKPFAETLEMVGCKKNGAEFPIEISSSLVQIRERKYTVAIVRDATERKRMQKKLNDYSSYLKYMVELKTAQLNDANERLVKSERLAAIGELAGMVGHDLRNPLTGIKNSAYFLKKKGAEISEAQAKEMLETIDKCVDYSNKIVNDLLDYSREISLERQDCSPKTLLFESLAMVNVPEKIIILDHLSDEPHLKVDSDKIKRVFINLIKNAIDAMPNGGKITIESKKVNGNLEISFADTGAGICDEILPKLFSPLLTTKAQGMGFGLAICKRLIEAHEGKITVNSVKCKGTTFTVTLPIKPKPKIGGEKIWINMPKSSLSMMTRT